MIVPIKTNRRSFYRQYLELIRTVAPLNNLRSRELDLLAEILHQRWKYKHFDEDGALEAFIFSTNMRKKMQKNVEMSEATFNNNLSFIKKQKIINDDFTLIKAFNVLHESDFSLTFKFQIDE